MWNDTGEAGTGSPVGVGQPFFCAAGHDFMVPLRDELLLADFASCPTCGLVAACTPPGEPEVLGDLRVRPSHWEQVRARRSDADLETLLAAAMDRAGLLTPRA